MKRYAVPISKFCSYDCTAAGYRLRTGPLSPKWSPGSRSRTGEGYIRIVAHWHPRASKSGHVSEHILVAEESLGRFLRRGEVVHHINGIKDDNRPENLMVLPSQSAHMRLHIAERRAMRLSKPSTVN
ncbi:HNH endonuclease [Alicyclobacillus sp. ALC3]|nr:HNH endonuclease [Alicyclobacillus sp. ALC3]